MTIHAPHPDSHTHGLQDECLRCQEHAEHPERGLDAVNLERLRSGVLLTVLDGVAAANLKRWDERRSA